MLRSGKAAGTRVTAAPYRSLYEQRRAD